MNMPNLSKHPDKAQKILQPGEPGYDPDLCFCYDCNRHYYPDWRDSCIVCEGDNVVNLDDYHY